jgi:aminopeptidase N
VVVPRQRPPALRTTIGDEKFFALLKEWPARKKFGNASSADFEAVAEEVSGQDLDALFDTWLHSTGKPAAAQGVASATIPASIRHMWR